MISIVSGVKIEGIRSVVPDHICKFEEELKDFPFPESSSRRLGKVMGFKEHRITDPKTTICDLSSYAISSLVYQNLINISEIDALIFVSQQREHPVPGNSKMLHGIMNLPKRIHCIDMYENCTGFISGLYTASCMIKAGGLKKILLINAEAGSCYANKKDRNTYPLCGDAAGITLITKGDDENDRIYFDFHHDTDLREILFVPAGGLRMPATEETAKLVKDETGNYRSLNQVHMDGTAVFHYVMDNVPSLLNELYSYAGITESEVDYHITHQPNRFMLEKLADLLEVPREKVFNNIVEYFGNTSSVTIPVNITHNLGEKLQNTSQKICFSAFGGGMSCCAAYTKLNIMKFCDLIEHPGNGKQVYE